MGIADKFLLLSCLKDTHPLTIFISNQKKIEPREVGKPGEALNKPTSSSRGPIYEDYNSSFASGKLSAKRKNSENSNQSPLVKHMEAAFKPFCAEMRGMHLNSMVRWHSASARQSLLFSSIRGEIA